jgi:hypothetical protein
MNLRQKLCDPFGGLRTETADQLEQIADEFAIEFIEWCGLRTVQITKSEWANWLPNADGSLSTKELLQIFKKEKGL